MQKIRCQVTVFFEAPFWVGLYERVEDNTRTVAKMVFGAEPKDYEVLEYLLHNWTRLRFSPPVQEGDQRAPARNPKRQQRAIKRTLAQTGSGTKAQQALSLAREETKLERKLSKRKRSEQEKLAQFALRQQKKKEKHRGH